MQMDATGIVAVKRVIREKERMVFLQKEIQREKSRERPRQKMEKE